MHKLLDEIKKNEGKTRVVKNFFDSEQVNALLKLYKNLPVEIFNKRQNIMKKKWSDNFEADLQKIFNDKLKVEIGDFFMDNPKTKDNLNSLGLFQESFSPVSVHADTGFNFDKVIYKQTLMPLTSKGETVIFKNKFYLLEINTQPGMTSLSLVPEIAAYENICLLYTSDAADE